MTEAAQPPPRRWPRRLGDATAILLLLLLLTWRPIARAIPGTLIEREAPRRADAIVVLAGDHHGGRVDRAVKLYQAGHLPEGPVVLSGGPIYAGTTWADLMGRRAIEQGVPEDRILRQSRSTTTAEDARFTLPLLQAKGAKTILLVTSAWHSERAAEHFRDEAAGKIVVVSCPAPDPPNDWWNDADATRSLVTEVLKRFWPGPGG